MALHFRANMGITVVNFVGEDLLVARLRLFRSLGRLLLAGLHMEAELGVTKHF